MRHTLVAAFDRPTDADRAKAALMSCGISQTHIHTAASNAADLHEYDTTSADDLDDRDDSKITRFFKSLFGTDTDNQRYADTYPEAVRRGSSVIAVDVDDDEEMTRAMEALESNGAIDIDERSAAWAGTGPVVGGSETLAMPSAGATTSTATTAATSRATASSPAEGRTIPVIEEELRVGKRERSAGRVRVVSHIEERPVQETVNLREEHVGIERRPVNRDATASELSGLRDESVEVRATREEPVIEKRAKVVEEIELKKDSTRRDETVRDTVRSTKVDIDRDDDTRRH